MDALRIFIINEQREYQKNLTLHILCLLVGSTAKNPFWNFFKSFQPALNEDLCERELSSLARAISNDTTGSRLEFCDKQFKLGSSVRNILERWEPERVTDERNTRWNGKKMDIRENDPDLHLVLQFFLHRIRQLCAPRLFKSYTGDSKTWRNEATAREGEKHILPKVLLLETSVYIPTLLEDLKRYIAQPFDDLTQWSNEIKMPPLPIPPQELPPEQLHHMEEVLAQVQIPIPPDDDDVFVNEYVEEKDTGPFLGDRKRNQTPAFLRQPLRHVADFDLEVPPPPTSEPLRFSATRTPKRGRGKARLGGTKLLLGPLRKENLLDLNLTPLLLPQGLTWNSEREEGLQPIEKILRVKVNRLLHAFKLSHEEIIVLLEMFVPMQSPLHLLWLLAYPPLTFRPLPHLYSLSPLPSSSSLLTSRAAQVFNNGDIFGCFENPYLCYFFLFIKLNV